MLTGAAWLFYRSLIAAAVLSPLSIFYCRYRIGQKELARQKLLAEQFRDALESINNALRAGDSPENAFREGAQEMAFQYGEQAPISVEMTRIINGLDNQVPLEKLISDFAARAQVEEIREFAEVFAIAKKGGGNMPEILGRTASLIEERLEVENEIYIALASRRMEARIMDLTPFLIIFYIGLTSPGFFDVLYHNAAGVIFMSICLGAYLAALAASEKILQISV